MVASPVKTVCPNNIRIVCPKCKGTGRNEAATQRMRELEPSLFGYVICSLCTGQGKY